MVQSRFSHFSAQMSNRNFDLHWGSLVPRRAELQLWLALYLWSSLEFVHSEVNMRQKCSIYVVCCHGSLAYSYSNLWPWTILMLSWHTNKHIHSLLSSCSDLALGEVMWLNSALTFPHGCGDITTQMCRHLTPCLWLWACLAETLHSGLCSFAELPYLEQLKPGVFEIERSKVFVWTVISMYL